MVYVPINTGAYTAAFAGAIAGMAVTGWITDPTAADYLPVCTIAGAFAEAFDTGWNDATSLNSLEVAAISEIASQNFKDRGPGPFTNAALATAANWQQTALACVALVLESDAYFAAQGITPPTPGGGSVLPLVPIYYVDNQYGSSTEDGSIGNPFKTLNAAIQFVKTSGLPGQLLVAGTAYSGETLDPLEDMNIAIVSLSGQASGPQSQNLIINTLACDTVLLTLVGCTVINLSLADCSQVILRNSAIVADVPVTTTGQALELTAENSRFQSDINADDGSISAITFNNVEFVNINDGSGAGQIKCTDCTSDGQIESPSKVVILENTSIDTSVLTSNFIARLSQVGASVTADAIRLEQTTVDTVNVNPGGQLFADMFSMTALRSGGPSTIEGLVITDLPLTEGITYTVPNLAAAMADVTGACPGARPGDTFVVSMEQRLAGVGIVGAWCAANNVLTLRFFGTTAGGDVEVNVNRLTNSG